MRQEARRSCEDMKAESIKRKHLLKFIETAIPKLIPKLNSDDYRDHPAIQVPCQRVENKFADRSKNATVEDASAKSVTKRKRNELEDEKDASDSDDEPLLTKKRKAKPKQSNSDSDIEERAINTGRLPKPRAPTSRPSLNISRASAPVSKAKTVVRRTPAKQSSTSSQTRDVKKPVQVSMTASKSRGPQVATPSVEPPSSARSQRVMSKLGAQLLEPVALGRRAEAARVAATFNQSPTTTPVIPARQTPTPISQKKLNFNRKPPVTPSTSSGSVSRPSLPSDASTSSWMMGSTNSSFTRTRPGPDRLAPIRDAKAAAIFSGSARTMVDFPQVSRPGSANGPPVSEALETSSSTVDEWQRGFADPFPVHSHRAGIECWLQVLHRRVIVATVLIPRGRRG